jgi:hypothetical protein
MSRILLGLCFAGAIAFVSAVPASAQSDKGEMTIGGSRWGDIATQASGHLNTRTGADSAYDSRALRLESHWGNFRIVRGTDGLVVGKTGLFRTVDVEKIVAGSPRAELEARLFRADHRPGAIAGALGAVTFVVGVVASSNNSNNAATPVLMVAGVGGMIWAARRLNTAYTALSRAVWWYNRDLVAGSGVR